MVVFVVSLIHLLCTKGEVHDRLRKGQQQSQNGFSLSKSIKFFIYLLVSFCLFLEWDHHFKILESNTSLCSISPIFPVN